jgi:hypothetical protein
MKNVNVSTEGVNEYVLNTVWVKDKDIIKKKVKDVFKEGVDKYSINMLWVDRNKNQEVKSIKSIEEFFEPAKKWASSNQKADINIWYDSKLYCSEAVENTKSSLKEVIEKEGTDTIKLDKIQLRDINDIPVVQENRSFFDEKISLYFRIDLLKLVICYHSLAAESLDAAIFADKDTGDKKKLRLDKKELFDERSMNMLEKWGALFHTNSGKVAENKFIQVVNNEHIIETLGVCINVSLNAAAGLLNNINSYEFQGNSMQTMYRIVYQYIIKDFLPSYYYGVKGSSIEVRADIVKDASGDEWVQYDTKKHGYDLLGNVYCANGIFYYVPGAELYSYDEIIRFNKEGELPEYYREYVRTDLNTRKGNDHEDTVILLEEGSHFKCKFIEKFHKKEILEDLEFPLTNFEKDKVEGELEEALKLPNSFSLADEVNDYTLTDSLLAGVADEI